MNAIEIVRRKRDGLKLADEEIRWLVDGCARGRIPDYQMSAWLMAVFLKGMAAEELTALTDAMMRSGETFDWSAIDGPKSDKHSTGGVGDKVSLILAPLAAACGLIVPMVSGRGLGHTGGTLDKLESIAGFDVFLSRRKIGALLKKSGLAMAGQTDRFVPADKKLYALRDVTATVESIPLIAASIMSKKMAEGCESLVLDVKTGSGAFMAKPADARELARTMIAIGRGMGRNVAALMTDMSQPTGRAIGNANEVVESIECLRGEWPADLKTITLALTAKMLTLAGLAKDRRDADAMMKRALDSGAALEKFRAMVEGQGGDPRVVDDPRRLKLAPGEGSIVAPKSGWIERFETREIGMAACDLGAGRRAKEDKIDHGVGLWIEVKRGERVEKGAAIFVARWRKKAKWDEARARLEKCFEIADAATGSSKPILETIE